MSQNGVYDTCNISRWLAALSSYWSVISASKSGGLTVLVPDVVKRKRKKKLLWSVCRVIPFNCLQFYNSLSNITGEVFCEVSKHIFSKTLI